MSRFWHGDHSHSTTAEYEKCDRSGRSSKRWAMAIMGVIVLVGVTADLAWNQYVYGDWRCAWAQCRKVEVVK